MRSIHFKFPEALFLRIEAQRKKDRLSPDRSEFIRRLLDLQLSRLEAADAREKTQRRPHVVPANAPAQSIQAAPQEPESKVLWTNAPGGPRAIKDYTIEIEMPDGVPANASPELLASLAAAQQRKSVHGQDGGRPVSSADAPSPAEPEPDDEPDLGNASGAKGLLGTLS
jgi:Arc/MetJ-type ribon-helix-helix transcriptional regulator